jgi:ubiquinone biosynthesis protein
MPAPTRLYELEAAGRPVCEPYFTRPLAEISLADVVVKLVQMARRHELTLQPQLILLQKTLLNIEGVGRLLHPGIDIWATAKPVLERIWRQRRGPRAALKMLRRRVPEWLAAAPDMPQLVHDYLTLATRGRLELRVASDDLKAIERRARRGQNLAVVLAVALSLVISGVLAGLMALSEPRAPYLGWASIVAIGAGLLTLVAARRLS